MTDERCCNGLMAAYHELAAPGPPCKLFERYRFEDYAFKVVGVGSVGTHCYVMLYLADDDDPLLLQVKEARPSVLEPYAGQGAVRPPGAAHCDRPAADAVGQRHVPGLGNRRGHGNHFYIRQLRDMKFSVPLVNLEAKGLANYAAGSAAGRWRVPTLKAAMRQ